MSRHDNRQPGQIRPITIEKSIAPHAQGSVLISFGNTKVICAAMIEESVPRWMKEQNVPGGWITAEYSMLPYSTLSRKQRDSSRGRPDGRGTEIQRLIGRSLRSVVDLGALGERSVWVDCDVIQADGGTRCASITGGYIALELAFRKLMDDGLLKKMPLRDSIAAISVGVVGGESLLDLPYVEDSKAEVDMNVVATGSGLVVEVQATAEGPPVERSIFDGLLDLALDGCKTLTTLQRNALDSASGR
jgi:ribonuclease PH